MSGWMISMFFAIGVTGWVYAKLARRTGNYSPKVTYGGALLAGVVAFIFVYTMFRFVLGFE